MQAETDMAGAGERHDQAHPHHHAVPQYQRVAGLRITALSADSQAAGRRPGVCLSAREAARDSAVLAGAEFVLAGAQPPLLRILTITHLDAAFGLRPRHGPAASPGSVTP
ncbi:hypothetical protein ABT272_42240 [Streptomyces sp900105245]|uniref:Uncharacterized protein n=1 Tax=Streptomyces sp. 900105245 TaxID=3154379 RepID=A0ABV1UKI0_9ACTN